MESLLSIAQVLIAIAMIAIILIQRGPGAAAGSGFGAGASGTVFGARGSGSFLTRSTAVLATGYFVVSLVMAVMAGRTLERDPALDLGVMNAATTTEATDAGDVPSLPAIEGAGEVPAAPAAVDGEAPPPEEPDAG